MLRSPTILKSSGKKFGPPQPRIYRNLAADWSTKAAIVNAAGLMITNTISGTVNAMPVGPEFLYVENKYVFDDDIEKPDTGFLTSCTCEAGTCTGDDCACIVASDFKPSHDLLQSPYLHNKLEAQVPREVEIVECNTNCACTRYVCSNRGSQWEREHIFDIFLKSDLTWGVRTTSKIPPKTILGVHTGLLVKRNKPFPSEDTLYCFNLDHDEIVGDSKAPMPDHPLYTVFSKNHGNWSRFLAHSVTPNVDTFMAVRDVPSGIGMPFIVFFAKRTIAPHTELTLNYHNTNPNPAHESDNDTGKGKGKGKGSEPNDDDV